MSGSDFLVGRQRDMTAKAVRESPSSFAPEPAPDHEPAGMARLPGPHVATVLGDPVAGLSFGRLAATPDDPRPEKNGSLLTEAERGLLDSQVVQLR